MLWALCKFYDRWQHKRRIKRECMEMSRLGIQLGLIKDVRIWICKEYIWSPFDEERMPVKYFVIVMILVCLAAFVSGKIVFLLLLSFPTFICALCDILQEFMRVFTQPCFIITSDGVKECGQTNILIDLLTLPFDFLFGCCK